MTFSGLSLSTAPETSRAIPICVSCESRPERNFENDRRFGWTLPVQKHGIRGHDKVDARTFDISERLNRTLQLAFQSALVVHFLVELGLPPVEFVEQLKSQSTAVRHPVRSDFHATRIKFVTRHVDTFAIRRNLVSDIFCRQLRAQSLSIGWLHARHQRNIVRCGDQMRKGSQDPNRQHHGASQQQSLLTSESDDKIGQLLLYLVQ